MLRLFQDYVGRAFATNSSSYGKDYTKTAQAEAGWREAVTRCIGSLAAMGVGAGEPVRLLRSRAPALERFDFGLFCRNVTYSRSGELAHMHRDGTVVQHQSPTG
jgi:hypothetical protein